MKRLEIRTCWHWMTLVAAGLFFAVHYLPAAYLSHLTADFLGLPILYQDIVEHGHSAQGWAWCGSSFEFPDTPWFDTDMEDRPAAGRQHWIVIRSGCVAEALAFPGARRARMDSKGDLSSPQPPEQPGSEWDEEDIRQPDQQLGMSMGVSAQSVGDDDGRIVFATHEKHAGFFFEPAPAIGAS